jgi:hypothetical protein
VRTITTGADDIDQMRAVRHLNLGCELAHDLSCRGDFADGFFFDPQAGQDGGCHERRDFSPHDHAHELQHLIVKNFTVLDGAL